jgi:cyclophilin family peptidyl-prolyl cis-trans isomerase/HEAT repeat protein
MAMVRARRAAVWAAALAASACATAPPRKTPVVPIEEKLASIVRLEDRRVLRDEPPPAVQVTPAPKPRGKQKAEPPPPGPDLRRLLTDPEPRVRFRAALAIGRVGLPEGIAPLTAALADANSEVRQVSAFALGLIGDRTAVPVLTKALADPDWLVRGRAAEALGLIGDPSAAADVGALAKEAASAGRIASIAPDTDADATAGNLSRVEPPADAFRLALYALVRLKAYEPLSAAVTGADGQPVGRWWPIAYALQRIEDPRAGAALLELARGPGRYTTAFAARGLGSIKHAGADAVLLPLVDPKQIDSVIGPCAVRALGQIGGQPALDALLALVRQPELDPNLRLEAVTALGALRASSARDDVLDQMADEWPSMRAAAIRAIAQIDPDELLLILSGLDPDPHWSVRAAIAAGLAEVPPEQAAERLQPMLADSDRRVVPAVLTSLARIKAPSLEATLLEHLKDPDIVVRMTAARLLGELKTPAHAAALADAYRGGSADSTYLARAAALTALTAASTEAAAPVLKQALADREWAVRLRALELLRPIDATAASPDAIRPAPIAAPPVPYESTELIAPPFSPRLFIETGKGTIEIELAVNDAPITAQQLIALARKDFYTGVTFHRVVPSFVAQGGDPRGDGEGGPGFTIRDELTVRPYRRGTVGMALDWEDTGGSQFFITHSPQPHLDGRYTVFGRVLSGMDVVDRIQQWDVIRLMRVWDGPPSP